MYYSTLNRPQPHRYIYLGANNNLARRSDSAEEREYSCGVGFSGQGSIGVLRRKGEQRHSCQDNGCTDSTPVWVEYQYEGENGTTHTTRVTLSEESSPSYLVECLNPSQRQEYLAGLAMRSSYARKLDRENVSPHRKRRVARSLTSRGRKSIRDGCSLLEYKYGHRRLGFYTLTCPFTDSDDIQHFNDSFPEILRRFFQELRREYERRQVCFSYVGVYEVQPRRFERTGDECLHFHFISPALTGTGQFVVVHRWLRAVYGRIVASVCGKSAGVLPRVDSQLLRKSGSGYLAKYFSKGGGADATRIRDGATATLSSWYSISRNLLTAIRRSRIELPRCYADALFRASRSGALPSYCSYVRPIFVESDDRQYHVGCVFRLTEDFMDTLREIVFPQVQNLI